MLQQQLAGMRTHFASQSGKGGKPDPKENAVSAAHVTSQHLLSAKPTADAAGALLVDAIKRLDAEKGTPPAEGVALAAARLGWAAAVRGQAQRAAELAVMAAAGAFVRPCLWADLTKIHVEHGLDRPCDDLSNAGVKKTQETLAALVSLLRGFGHVCDVEGVHAACK